MEGGVVMNEDDGIFSLYLSLFLVFDFCFWFFPIGLILSVCFFVVSLLGHERGLVKTVLFIN